MEWKYVEALKNPKAVSSFLLQKNIVLPESLVALLVEKNGGKPEEDEFDTEIRQGYYFKCLLSYNTEDYDTIYKNYTELLEERQLFPIALDGAGNDICYNIRKAEFCLFNHETMEIEKIVKCPAFDI